jgi:hypothetical protein
MLNKIYDWFDLHTTDTILSSLDAMVVRLRKHAEKLHAQAIDHKVEAAKLLGVADAKAASADKAVVAANNISALIG